MATEASAFDSRVEAFAELTARLEAPFADRAAILAEAGLDQARCAQVQAAWSARLREATDDLPRRFAEAYAEARRAIAAHPAAPRSGVPERAHEAPPSPPPVVTPPVVAPSLVVAPPLVAAPPLVVAPPPAWVAAEPPVEVAATADVTAFVPRDALPFAPLAQQAAVAPRPALDPAVDAARAAVRADAPVPVPASSPPAGSETGDVSAVVPRPPTPFAGASASHGAASTSAAPPFAPWVPPAGSETGDISAFIPRGELPFTRTAERPIAPVTAESVASAGSPVGVPGSAGSPVGAAPPGSGTEDVSAFLSKPAVPFGAPAGRPQMRLVRFDPQTGQPLAQPRWEEIPSAPDPSKSTERP